MFCVKDDVVSDWQLSSYYVITAFANRPSKTVSFSGFQQQVQKWDLLC